LPKEWFQSISQALGVDLADITLIAVWLFSFLLARKLLAGERKDDRGRQDLATLAGKLNERLTVLYENAVTLMLSWVDRGAGDRFLDVAALFRVTPHSFSFRHRLLPWSNGLYDLTLKLALAYPIVFLVAGWAWIGGVMPGLEVFLPAVPEGWRRGLYLAPVVVLSVFLIFQQSPAKLWRRWLHAFITMTAVLAVVFLLFLSGPIFDVPRGVALTVFVAAYVAGIAALSVTIGGGGGGAFAVTFTIFLTVTFALALAGVGYAALFGTLAIIFTFAVAIAYLSRLAHRLRLMTLFHIVYWLVVAGVAITSFHVLARFETPKSVPLLIIFVVVLPLANAPLDWISLDLTRGLLRYGLVEGGTWRIAAISLVDIILAAVLIFPLAATTAAVLCLANWSAVSGGGEAILPVVPILEAFRRSPLDPDFYWIYLMLFSTLIPSVAHILGGLVGLVLACLQPVFRAAMLAQKHVSTETGEHAVKDTKLLYWYPALAAFGVTALVVIISLLGIAAPYVRAGAIYFAEWLLATAEWTASFFPG
jgi:hypothetical protein